MKNGNIKATIEWDGYDEIVEGLVMEKLVECNPDFSIMSLTIMLPRHNNRIVNEEKKMTVKVKKQPKTITTEELKNSEEEYKGILIHINQEKKEEIENKYGIKYSYNDKVSIKDGEIEFKENYLQKSI